MVLALAAVAIGVILLLVVVLAIVLAIVLARKRTKPGLPPVDLRIDVLQLPAGGPPAEGPLLEYYGIPVRLVAVVLAPAGRNNQLPPQDRLPAVLDDLVPRLAEVVQQHGPILRQWPAQLSTQGFTQTFLNQVRLPGDRGKGTPWCSVVGRFETHGQQLLAGLLCVAHKPNSMTQVAVNNMGQWMDVLRIKGSAAD